MFMVFLGDSELIKKDLPVPPAPPPFFTAQARLNYSPGSVEKSQGRSWGTLEWREPPKGRWWKRGSQVKKTF